MNASEIGVRMPALFLAHGNPMNAVADNDFTRTLALLAKDLPRPQAILVVSAHWLTRGTHVLSAPEPRTIHDFGGFPEELYQVQYPAPGAPTYARLVHELAPEAALDDTWGLDHASWTVLRHMWPGADIPVFELSVDMSAHPQIHWDLGRSLAPLRDHGVLVVGSGNIVHSFAGVRWEPDARPHAWAEEFDAYVGRRPGSRRPQRARELRGCGHERPPLRTHERPLPASALSGRHAHFRR